MWTEEELALLARLYYDTVGSLSNERCAVIADAIYSLFGRRVTPHTIRTRINMLGLSLKLDRQSIFAVTGQKLPERLQSASPVRDWDTIRGFTMGFKVRPARKRPCDRKDEQWLEIV